MKKCLPIIFCIFVHSVWAENVNILDFQAVADGTTLCTEAIQKAIDHCADTGGGVVTVPEGLYLTNTVFLRNHVNLHIQRGAVLLGSTDPKAFTQAVVYAEGIQNAAITGQGTIDGQGFKKYYPTSGPRHNNIRLHQCKNITVQDVTLINSSNWVFRILQCDGVIVRGVRIYSFTNENNDGIDIDGKNITISDCIIDCDDDAVCLKSDDSEYLVENVSISNCVIASNCNAIKFGTASHCGFKNITISNCVVRRPSESVHRKWSERIQGVTSDDTVISGIALEVVDGGFMDQIAISNISMTGVQTPLFIRLGNRRGRGTLKNVVISNIMATNESLITSSITGIPGSYVENVKVSDIILQYKGTGTIKEAIEPVPEKEGSYPENRMFGYSLPAYGLYVRHVRELTVENFTFKLLHPDARPAVVLDDCHDAVLNGFSVDTPTQQQPLFELIESTNITLSDYRSTKEIPCFIRAKGEKCSDIKLLNNDLRSVEKVIDLQNGCKETSILLLNNFE